MEPRAPACGSRAGRTASMEGPPPHAYRLWGRRWLMLALGFVVNFGLVAVEQPFTPSARAAARYLGVSVGAVHWLKYAWSLPAVAAAIPGLAIAERFGLRRASALCAVLLIAGVALRCAELAAPTAADGIKTSVGAYALVVLGTVVASAGAIPIQASTTYIAAAWFDDGRRGLANTLMLLAVPAGLHFNALLHALLGLAEPGNARRFRALLLLDVLIAALTLPAALLLRNFPPTPPCASAEQPFPPPPEGLAAAPLSRRSSSTSCSPSSHASPAATPLSARDAITSHFATQRARRAHGKHRDGLFADLPRLLRVRPFWLLLVAFSLTLGAFSTYYLLFDELLDRTVRSYAATSEGVHLGKLAGSFGAIAFIAGFVGFLLDRTHAFKSIMGISQTAVLAFAVGLSAKWGDARELPRVQACLVCMGIMGFLILPTALEMSAEVGFPFSALLAAGLLWMGAHLMSVALGLLLEAVTIDHAAATPRFARGQWVLLACFAVACLLWWLFPVRYVRGAAEKLYKDVQTARHKREAARRERRGGGMDRRAMTIEDRNQISRKLFTITEALNTRSSTHDPYATRGSTDPTPPGTGRTPASRHLRSNSNDSEEESTLLAISPHAQESSAYVAGGSALAAATAAVAGMCAAPSTTTRSITLGGLGDHDSADGRRSGAAPSATAAANAAAVGAAIASTMSVSEMSMAPTSADLSAAQQHTADVLTTQHTGSLLGRQQQRARGETAVADGGADAAAGSATFATSALVGRAELVARGAPTRVASSGSCSESPAVVATLGAEPHGPDLWPAAAPAAEVSAPVTATSDVDTATTSVVSGGGAAAAGNAAADAAAAAAVAAIVASPRGARHSRRERRSGPPSAFGGVSHGRTGSSAPPTAPQTDTDAAFASGGSFATNAYSGVPNVGKGLAAPAIDDAAYAAARTSFPASALHPSLSNASAGPGGYVTAHGTLPTPKSHASAAESFATAAGAEWPHMASLTDDPANFGAEAASVHSGSDADLSGIGENTTTMRLGDNTATMRLREKAAAPPPPPPPPLSVSPPASLTLPPPPPGPASQALSSLSDLTVLSSMAPPERSIVWWKNPLLAERGSAGMQGTATTTDASAALQGAASAQEVLSARGAGRSRPMAEIALAVLPQRPRSHASLPPPPPPPPPPFDSALLPQPDSLHSSHGGGGGGIETSAARQTLQATGNMQTGSFMADPVAGLSVRLQEHEMNMSTMQDTMAASAALPSGSAPQKRPAAMLPDAARAGTYVLSYSGVLHSSRGGGGGGMGADGERTGCGLSTTITDPFAHVDVQMANMIQDTHSNLLTSDRVGTRPDSASGRGGAAAPSPGAQSPAASPTHSAYHTPRGAYASSSAPTSGGSDARCGGPLVSLSSLLQHGGGGASGSAMQSLQHMSLDLMGSARGLPVQFADSAALTSAEPSHAASPPAVSSLGHPLEDGSSFFAAGGSVNTGSVSVAGGVGPARKSQLLTAPDVTLESLQMPSTHLGGGGGGVGMSTELMASLAPGDEGTGGREEDSAHITCDTFSVGRTMRGASPRAAATAVDEEPVPANGPTFGGGVARSPQRNSSNIGAATAMAFSGLQPLPLPHSEAEVVDFAAQLKPVPLVPALDLGRVQSTSASQPPPAVAAATRQQPRPTTANARDQSSSQPLPPQKRAAGQSETTAPGVPRPARAPRALRGVGSGQIPAPSGHSRGLTKEPQQPEHSVMQTSDSSAALPSPRAQAARSGMSSSSARLAKLFGDSVPARRFKTACPARGGGGGSAAAPVAVAPQAAKTGDRNTAASQAPVATTPPTLSPPTLQRRGSCRGDACSGDLSAALPPSAADAPSSVGLSLSGAIGGGGWSLSDGLEHFSTHGAHTEAPSTALAPSSAGAPQSVQGSGGAYAAKPPLSGGSSRRCSPVGSPRNPRALAAAVPPPPTSHTSADTYAARSAQGPTADPCQGLTGALANAPGEMSAPLLPRKRTLAGEPPAAPPAKHDAISDSLASTASVEPPASSRQALSARLESSVALAPLSAVGDTSFLEQPFSCEPVTALQSRASPSTQRGMTAAGSAPPPPPVPPLTGLAQVSEAASGPQAAQSSRSTSPRSSQGGSMRGAPVRRRTWWSSIMDADNKASAALSEASTQP